MRIDQKNTFLYLLYFYFYRKVLNMFLGIPMVEWIGYAASLSLMVSFMFKDVKKLRLINSLGAIFFIVYGFFLPNISIPIIITNVFILGANIYYLFFNKKTTNT